jgi:hypothetical protein
VKLVRLPFRWERIQPTLNGALDVNELGRLRAAISRAAAAGIKVVPTVFNYGGYRRCRSRRTPICGRSSRPRCGGTRVSRATAS